MSATQSTLLTLGLFLASSISPAYTQIIDTLSWRDGSPRFLQVDLAPQLSSNVVFDSVAALQPVSTSISEPDSFRATIQGIDWPANDNVISVNSPQDIDKVPTRNLYLITDGSGRKVLTVNPSSNAIVTEFGAGLAMPVDAFPFFDSGNNFNVLITDRDAHRVLLVDWFLLEVKWSYGGTQGSGANQLSSPSDACMLPNGSDVLICDTGNNRVVLVDTTTKSLRWSYSQGLAAPVDVEYEATTGYALITDGDNHRVLLVDIASSAIVWRFGNGQAGNSDSTLNSPNDADLLANGNILIADSGNNRLIEIDRQTRTIVYRHANSLFDLRDADRIEEAGSEHNNKTLVVARSPRSGDVRPLRLAFRDETYVSAKRDFTRLVQFDSLRIRANTPTGTSLRLQLRTAVDSTALATAQWFGPSDTSDFYTSALTAINLVHDGHRCYQFRAFLHTDSTFLLFSPELLGVQVQAHYYPPDSVGSLTSEVIQDSAGKVITQWLQLVVNTILPADPQTRGDLQLDVRLLDDTTNSVLFGAVLSNVAASNSFDLSQITALRLHQRLRLQAIFRTNNTAVTPRLDDWQLTWERPKATTSQLRFTDAEARPVSYYRVPNQSENPSLNTGIVFLALDDSNLVSVQSFYQTKIYATLSRDSVAVRLEAHPSGQYRLGLGIPAVVTPTANSGNSILEVRDRDTLVVSYTDPTDATDSSRASALIIGNGSGRIQIENSQVGAPDTILVGETLFLRIVGEKDRDLTADQDSVEALLQNTRTQDTERIKLYEIRNRTNEDYDTGEFISRIGILTTNVFSASNDGKLQALPGDNILAIYNDNTTLLDTVLVVQSIPSSPSTLRFADASFQSVASYRVPGSVFLALEDQNLPLVTLVDTIAIRASLSGDRESIPLTFRASGDYRPDRGFPAVVDSNATPDNDTLEVFDRDILVAQYVDPSEAADTSSASALVIKSVRGEIQAESVARVRITAIDVGDSLHIRVSGETDRDISSALDSVQARFVSPRTGDLEVLRLFETSSHSAIFISRSPIPTTAASTVNNDGRLSVLAGEQIRAEYSDNDTLPPYFVQVRAEPDTGITIFTALDFRIAPNPFNARRHSGLRLAASAGGDDYVVERIEIYNFAGERVREINGSSLGSARTVARGQNMITDNWWDMRAEDGSQIASGTYWAKFYVVFTGKPSSPTGEVLRKFVIVR